MRDVIVAGAGPAGAAAATVLARAGFDVLVCDRARFPRDTLCGEFLSPEASASLERLGVAEAVDALRPVDIDRLRLVAPDGHDVERALDPPGRGATRHGLDACLLAHAEASGAESRLGCRVTGCTSGPDFAVSMLVDGRARTEHARAVLDATGHARWLSRGGERGGERSGARPGAARRGGGRIGIKRHFRTRWPADGTRDAHTLVLAAFDGGYVGRAPVEGGVVNICLLVSADRLRAAGGRPEALFARLGESPAIAHLLDGLAPIGGFTTTSGLVFGRAPGGPVLSVGDAAGMIAPLAGDGVAMALRSGELAADALIGFLDGSDAWGVACARYRRAWRREFAGRVRLSGVLQRVATRPAASNGLVSLLARWPRAIDLLVAGTRGRASAPVVRPPRG